VHDATQTTTKSEDDHRLPRTVLPRRYELRIEPDLDAATFSGEESVAVEVVDDESLMDAVTALSGSGPAYVYRFAEALIEAGAQSGLAHALAERLAYETIAGAAEMMIRTGENPRTLREAVSSPGGTTLAGLAALDGNGFYASVVAGVAAAKRRSEELGKS